MYYLLNKKAAKNGNFFVALAALLFIFSSALPAQHSTVKVYKASNSDTISVKNSDKSKLRILSSSADQKWMDEIDPDDIASVDVTKKDGVGVIKLTLKNGEVIEKEVSDSNRTSKSRVMTVVFDADEENNQANYLKWEELKEIDPDEIKSVDVSKNDTVSVVTVTLKNGEVIEKEMDNAASDKVKVFAKTIELDEISFDQLSEQGNVFIFDTTDDEEDILALDAFKDLDEDEIKEVMVKAKDGVKTITVTTKAGEILEETIEDSNAIKSGSNVIKVRNSGKKTSWSANNNVASNGVKLIRLNQQDKIDALEERLERMEKKLDELLDALKNADSGNTSTKKKKKG